MKKLSNNKLIVRWDKRQNDVILSWPKSATDAHLVMHRLFGVMPDEGLMVELEQRGYDVTTFRFEISLSNVATNVATPGRTKNVPQQDAEE